MATREHTLTRATEFSALCKAEPLSAHRLPSDISQLPAGERRAFNKALRDGGLRLHKVPGNPATFWEVAL